MTTVRNATGFGFMRQHVERLEGGSRSFHAASRLLPVWMRDPATVLYAYCRVADDAIDTSDDPMAALAQLRVHLDAIYAGEPVRDPIDQDFTILVHRYGIARELPEALLEGFLWDVQGRVYEDLPQLEAYAARVAGSVGVMMALLMGVRDPSTLARAADLGVAMQLTNIARDVAEDARAGRCYLPLRWLREAGLDVARWRAQPHEAVQVDAAVAKLLAAAQARYRLADGGVAGLPPGCRFGIQAARLLYSAIGDELARRDWNPFSGRAVVPGARKLALLGLAGWQSWRPGRLDRSAVSPGCAFLVDAVQKGGPAVANSRPAPLPWLTPRRKVNQSVLAVFHLFLRLQQAERSVRGGPR